MGALPSSVAGGVRHGLAVLSQAEREAAQKALAKLTSPGAGLGSNLSAITGSATVSSGLVAKSTGTGAPTLLHGQANDTMVGGAGSALTPATAGSDTVVGGSASQPSASGPVGPQSGSITLSADTVNVAGATAESVKAAQSAAASARTITLKDKTTVTISGVSGHDIKHR
jgi:hypothetical protein